MKVVVSGGICKIGCFHVTVLAKLIKRTWSLNGYFNDQTEDIRLSLLFSETFNDAPSIHQNSKLLVLRNNEIPAVQTPWCTKGYLTSLFEGVWV